MSGRGGRAPDADRRRAGGRRVGHDLRQRQPGDRRGRRSGRRRRARRHGARAIAAARRAFDETDWATNPELRKRCLRQLQEALAKEREVLRPQIVAEVGTRSCSRTRCRWTPASTTWSGTSSARPRRVGGRPPGARVLRHAQRPAGRARADRRGRRDHAVELPVHAQPLEDRPGARGRQHRGPQARARHAVERDVHRQARGRVHRHPAGRVQRRHVERPGGGR